MAMAGTEWLVDASGCRADALRDAQLLREMFNRIIAELNLRVVGESVWHEFPSPGGVTGMALLTESHLTCHTYPEHQLATLNLYCCRRRPAWNWTEGLREMIGATCVEAKVIERGNLIEQAIVLPKQFAVQTSGGKRRA